MTGEIFNSTDQKRNKFFWRYVFAAIIFLMLILIWPLSLLKITDPYVNNRLLKQEGDYSYFYVSSGEYLTTVIKGNGELVPNVAIRLRFQEEVPENASMEAYVFDSEGNVVIDQHISIFPRPENDIYEIPFDLELGKDRSYQFVLAPESDFTIGVYCSNGTSEPAVLLQSSSPALPRALNKVSVVLVVCIWMCGLLLIVSLLFGERLSKVSSCAKSSNIYVPALFSFIGLIVYGQYLADYNTESVEGIGKGIILIVAFTIMSFLCTFARKRELLIMGFMIFIVGSIYLLTFPEGMVPDENTHFYRAFSLAFGNFQAVKFSDVSVGGVLPRAIRDIADKNAVLDFTDTIEIDFKNTSLYSPICYLPQIIGIRIALLFTSKIHLVFMTARWCGFVGAFILYMLALHIAPVGRKFMLVVMMLPMAMQEMTGVTSDAMTNAFSFLFVALVLKYAADNKKLSIRQIVTITIVGTCVALCKLVYAPLLLMALVIPFDLFKDENKTATKNKVVYAAVFAVPLLACAVTNSILGKNLVPVGENVDAALQIKYVLTHIPDTLMIVVRTIVNSSSQWFHEMTGDFLGGLNIRTIPVVTSILLLMLYISARDMKLTDNFKTTKAKWIFGLTFFAGYLIILAILYVSWTTIGYFIIRGIQGRYYIAFLPSLGLFIASLYSGRNVRSAKVQEGKDKLAVAGYNVHKEKDKLVDAEYNVKEEKGEPADDEYSTIGFVVYTHILFIINMIVIVDIFKYLTVN